MIYDLAIIGGGPAGVAAALAAQAAGVKSILILEAEQFPRDKVCGDFIERRGLRLLQPYLDILAAMEKHPERAINRYTRLQIQDQVPLRWQWKQRSYVMRRQDFDQLLWQSLSERPGVDQRERQRVEKVERTEAGFLIRARSGESWESRWLIGADGAHSQVARHLAQHHPDKEHLGGSVRAYFTGISGLETSCNEIYADQRIGSGYFWIFPLGADSANVGLGMHSRHMLKRRVDLKQLFKDFIAEHPHLAGRFRDAQRQGPLKGFGLPFYDPGLTYHGDGYLLAGDAASLIDPINGEGIYQALYSGVKAGQQIAAAQAQPEQASKHLAAYSADLRRTFHRNFWKKHLLVKYASNKPWLLRSAAGILNRFSVLQKRVQSWM